MNCSDTGRSQAQHEFRQSRQGGWLCNAMLMPHARQGTNFQNCRPREPQTTSSHERRHHPRRIPIPQSLLPRTAMLSRHVFRTVRAAAPQRAVVLRAAPVRTFAAAASGNDGHPPITVFGLDGTYATALVRTTSPRPRKRISGCLCGQLTRCRLCGGRRGCCVGAETTCADLRQFSTRPPPSRRRSIPRQRPSPA